MDEDYYDDTMFADDFNVFEERQIDLDREGEEHRCRDCYCREECREHECCMLDIEDDPCEVCDLSIDCANCEVYHRNREEPEFGPHDGGFSEPDVCVE